MLRARYTNDILKIYRTVTIFSEYFEIIFDIF